MTRAGIAVVGWATLAMAASLSAGPGSAQIAPPVTAGGADRLALVEETAGGQDILVLDVGRGTTTRVARGLAQIEALVWSPDGSRLAYAARSGGAFDGSAVRALTGGNACGLSNESEGKLNSLGQAAWTADGQRLLYRAGVCKMDCRVCVIDVAGSRVYPLVAERMVTAFALAPDGRSVAWTRDRQIVVSDLEGNGRRALIQDGWGPAWSRDGRRIAFLETAGSDPFDRRYHVETIEPDGGNRRRVTQRPGNYWGLVWSPVPAGRP